MDATMDRSPVGSTGNVVADVAANSMADSSATHQHEITRQLKLGMFTALRLYAQGRRDGRRGLPSQSEGGAYTSPFIARELDEHQQFCATSRLYCDRRLVRLRQKIVQLEKEQTLLESTISETEASLKRHRAGFEPHAQAPRNTSEQRLDAALLQNRRLAEFEKSLTSLVRRVDSARAALESKQIEHAAISAGIEQEERLSHEDCERHACRTERKIAAYWQAAFTTHRAARPHERLPLHPPFPTMVHLRSEPRPNQHPAPTFATQPSKEQESSWD
jgi:hypothetical protein